MKEIIKYLTKKADNHRKKVEKYLILQKCYSKIEMDFGKIQNFTKDNGF